MDKITLNAKKLDEAMHKLKLANYANFKLLQEAIDLIQEAILSED